MYDNIFIKYIVCIILAEICVPKMQQAPYIYKSNQHYKQNFILGNKV